MIFEDVFYPGNPARRKQVENLRHAIKSEYEIFKAAWNGLAETLNGAFAQITFEKFKNVRLLALTRDIEKDTLQDCCEEIGAVVVDADSKLTKLVKDCELDKLLPSDWKEKGVNLDSFNETQLHEFGQKLSFLGDGAVSSFVGFYALKGSYTLIMERCAVESLLGKMAAGTASFLAGAVIGAAVFVISDMIMGAIFGAQERKELNDAIDTLTAVKQDFDKYIGPEQVGAIDGIRYMLSHGRYQLDDTYWIEKQDDGTYAIVTYKKVVCNSLSTTLGNNVSRVGRVLVTLGKAKAA